MPDISYSGHPVRIVQVWPGKNVMGEKLFTVRSLSTDQEWDVWDFELRRTSKPSSRASRRRASKR
jgi:hypothetical protein